MIVGVDDSVVGSEFEENVGGIVGASAVVSAASGGRSVSVALMMSVMVVMIHGIRNLHRHGRRDPVVDHFSGVVPHDHHSRLRGRH